MSLSEGERRRGGEEEGGGGGGDRYTNRATYTLERRPGRPARKVRWPAGVRKFTKKLN